MTLGPNLLAFNNHWSLDLDTILRLFKGWRLKDAVADSWPAGKAVQKANRRADL